jgi:hypothetical protein
MNNKKPNIIHLPIKNFSVPFFQGINMSIEYFILDRKKKKPTKTISIIK